MTLAKERDKMLFRTSTGRYLDPLDITSTDIDIRDIAKALSLQCRFGGHCGRFYSVAEHSVMVSLIARILGDSDYIQKVALLHDATEAYLVDIPTPFKRHIPQYATWEGSIWETICERFTLEPISITDIKYADKQALRIEMNNFFPEQTNKVDSRLELLQPRFLAPDQAEQRFLATYEFLFNGTNPRISSDW